VALQGLAHPVVPEAGPAHLGPGSKESEHFGVAGDRGGL
jgi:hypothetical protein